MDEPFPKDIPPNGTPQNSVDTTDGKRLDIEQFASILDKDRFEALFDSTHSSDTTQMLVSLSAGYEIPLTDILSPGPRAEKTISHPRLPIEDDNQRQPPSDRAEVFRPFNDRYSIAGEIGTGGMGSVYLGWDRQLQRNVAIKTSRQDQIGNPLHQHRFLREARIASRLSHPGILGIHDFGVETSGSAFIIMDLITGKTMEDAIADAIACESKRQSLLTAFFQICQAMAYAHDHGVVHRDLKPANIMVGDYGLAIVLDWGLAKVLGTSDIQSNDLHEEQPATNSQRNDQVTSNDPQGHLNTLFGTIMGTLNYLSPEQARGEVVGFRSDVFSLGGILCHLLSGSPPFVGKELFDVYKQSASGNMVGAFDRLDRCGSPIQLVQLAKRCLEPDSAKRPENASFLVEGLKQYLESGQRRAEEELVRFFDLSLDLFCIANTDGYFWRLNSNFTRTLGYTSSELTSVPFLDFVHPDDRPDTINEIVKLAKGESTIQFVNRYRHKNGHYISLEWTARSLEAEGVVYAVAREISERIRLENERVRIESERFRLAEIVDSASDAIIGKDLSGVVQSWNMGAEKLLGYTAEEMIGKRIHEIIPNERLEEENLILERVGRGETVESFETVRIHKCGERIEISLSVSPIRDVFGNIVGASKIARSIANQRRMERELERSRHVLIEFAENANVPLHCVDQTGTIVWANDAELSFLGYSRDEYIGEPIAKFHASQEVIADIFDKLVQGKTLVRYLAKLIAKDGSVKEVAIFSSPYQVEGKMVHTRCFTIDLNLLQVDDCNVARGLKPSP